MLYSPGVLVEYVHLILLTYRGFKVSDRDRIGPLFDDMLKGKMRCLPFSLLCLCICGLLFHWAVSFTALRCACLV